ncbi:hypothetical protein [Pectobacterium sp. IFB5596]|uniref:hypothetical protein n=1 Tax=Pectobacterium sp. IFB5596 TaxID=1839803 RepID=UPI001F188D65|nr:hypothetical protein [Pectobacterium sp. IFB5596]MCE9729709.1 hypothetical protein [Pectobacterium sp. IFB5596]
MFGWRKKEYENNYIKLLLNIPSPPTAWHPRVEIAVGGLTEIGFSHRQNHLLLVISSSGRGVFNCITGEKVARDVEEYGSWYDPINLTCKGIGPLADEDISIAGLCGGGLPMCNQYGETLVRAAPEWPLEVLIWCPPSKDALCIGHQEGCLKLLSDHFRCTGFSWNGEFIISATSSDITVWHRKPSFSQSTTAVPAQT